MRHLSVGVVAAIVVLAGGVIAAQSQPKPDAGAQTAIRQRRILQLRDDLLREKVVRPYLQERAKSQREGRIGAAGAGNPSSPVVGRVKHDPASGLECVDVLCSRLGPLGCETEERALTIVRACAGNYTGDCVRAVCRRLGPLSCRSLESAQRAGEACAFNASSQCLDAGCSFTGPLTCDDMAAMTRILEACAGNPGDACARDVCAHMGELGCSTIEDFSQVARACRAIFPGF